jgi:ribose transport system substrate-binding protein
VEIQKTIDSTYKTPILPLLNLIAIANTVFKGSFFMCARLQQLKPFKLLRPISTGLVLLLCSSVFADTGKPIAAHSLVMKQVMTQVATQVVERTIGPHGEAPTPYTQVRITATDIARLKAKKASAAIVMHTSSEFSSAVIAGIKKGLSELGIQVLAVTDADMDPKKQRADVETVLTLKPDLIIALVIDPVSGEIAFQQAVRQGVKLVFISNPPQGFQAGRHYAGIVTDDLFGMGKAAAEMLADSIAAQGDVAVLHHAANYYVTNQRDQAVKTVLRRYPNIRIVADKGIANPAEAEMIAAAILTQHPKIKAIYAPWDAIAEGVIAALRSAGRKDVKVVTMDLGAATALDMLKTGNMAGIVSDLPYDMGTTLASMGGLALLDKTTPAFVTVDAVKVTPANLKAQWQKALARPLPPILESALRKNLSKQIVPTPGAIPIPLTKTLPPTKVHP